ncbi:pentatricopeptide repeat-containing protein At5g39710 [Selaginella moellendorffii]|nr:pentatricopeptide repeat-containing protein At5g39710 [Selaginella moellendorffii]|eukprot:XP_002991993.2 pentatricopeptide repeat-containing protein At5g39710 [Selaginella moellendorffii]
MRCCIGALRRASGMTMVVPDSNPRAGSQANAAMSAEWLQEMKEESARRVREQAARIQALEEGERLLRAHSRSLLGSYKGRLTPIAAAFAIGKTRNPAEARALFDWAGKQTGFIHNGETCAALLRVFHKARLAGDAFALFTRDLWRYCARSAIAYKTMVEGYCYVGDMDPATRILAQMEKMGFHIDVGLHNAILRGLIRAKRVDDALDHFAKMEKNRDTDLESYSIVVSALCDEKRVDKAVDLLYSMNEESFLPDVGIYNRIIEAMSELQLHGAYLLFEQMIEAGVLPNSATFSFLVRGCFKRGFLDEGSELLRQMVESGCVPELATFNAVIEGLCKVRRVENARWVMNEMASQGCSPDAATHRFLLEALCKMDKLDEAHRHVQRMIATGCLPDTVTYSFLIKKLCKEGRPMEAHRIFKEMIGIGREPDSSIYNLLLASHCAASKATACYELFTQMKERGVLPEPRNCLNLVRLLHKFHRFAEAREVGNAIPEVPLLLLR